MRNVLLALALTTSACATTSATNNAGHVNVAFIRHEIRTQIDAQPDARAIVSMGHVTETSAVVYTSKSPDAPRQEETWVKSGGAWKLHHTTAVGASVSSGPSASR